MFKPKNAELLEQLDQAPKRPGCYIFRSIKNEILYIGKAVNLYNRSRSYFVNYKRLDPRLRVMVEQIDSVEYIEVENEVEALLLETNLIKKHQPKYNVLMTDDKNYLWVKVYSKMDFPKVSIVRNKKDDGADYFGPFPNKKPITRMLRQLRRIFPYRSCNRVIEEREGEDGETKIYSNDKKPCLYYDLGLCTAPCTTEQSKEEYREQINNLKRFFRSQHNELKLDLQKKMAKFAEQKNYEKAAEIRDQLQDLEYLTKFSRINESMDEVALQKTKRERSLEGVEILIDRLQLNYDTSNESMADFRIECYDISNIQGTNATSSMVVAVGGEKKKGHYRKFKIKTENTPDDFRMLRETLDRRFKHLYDTEKHGKDMSFSNYPDLIVIDGGKGQLSSVLKILHGIEHKLSQSIPVIGLAKREEEVFRPVYIEGELEFKLVKFSKRSPALHILQMVRDEAHRFGLGYHRLLRSKGMTSSELDLIPGVGEVLKKRLILAFGSVEKIKKAKLHEIEAVVKNRNTARKIKKLLV